jgi:curli production assembly/transport component CsgG
MILTSSLAVWSALFWAGGSVKYRQDRVTVYLRMVSTSNGKILNSVYVSKTILSQAIDQSLRYVNFKRLLEVETGYTTNEPIQMAVTEAIEKAVHLLFWNKGRYFRNRGPKGRGRCVTSCLKKENETADGSKNI